MPSKHLVWWAVVVVLLATTERGASGQNSGDDRKQEQRVFDAEPDSDKMLVKSPVEIPESALQVLGDTLGPGTLNCLKARGATPDQVRASWFLASVVHLNGPNEVDLIILPNVPDIANPKNAGGCLLSAHGGPFWVLGPGIASGRYGLLLVAYADRLEILGSVTNGYRDIRAVTGRGTMLYKFTVHQYQLAEKKTEP